MKLTAYDLSRDKGAILAAVLERTANPVPAPKPAPKVSPVKLLKPAPKPAKVARPAKPPKPKAATVKVKPAPAPRKPAPKPARKKGPQTRADVLARAKLVYDLQSQGMEKASIMAATGMTEHQYKAALRAAHRNGIIPPGFQVGQRQQIPVTAKVKYDLRRLSRACFCEKYGCSVKTVSLMRKRLGIDNVVFVHRWYAEDVAKLFEHRAAGLSYEAIGAIYGVTGASIGEIIRKAKKRGIECYPLRPKNK